MTTPQQAASLREYLIRKGQVAPRDGDEQEARWAREGLDYDGMKDLAGSIAEGFRAIRERKAAGGPGWEQKP